MTLQRLGDLIPETMTRVREKFEWWQSLTDEEKAEQLARWDEEARLAHEDELRSYRKWDAEQIPARYYGASVEDFPESVRSEVYEWVEAICEDPSFRGLLIAGPTGVGKTRLMWAIYLELASRSGPRMEVVKLVKLLASLRPGGETTQEALTQLCRVPLLAIDDIGAHKPSEWVNERLYEIIDTRYDNCKPIIATTNRKNLEGVVDDRVLSRIEEGCKTLVLTGPDRRRAA